MKVTLSALLLCTAREYLRAAALRLKNQASSYKLRAGGSGHVASASPSYHPIPLRTNLCLSLHSFPADLFLHSSLRAVQQSQAAFASCQDKSGTNGTRPNMCAKEVGSPFCINTAKAGEDPTFECRECDPDRGGDCDCSPGKYCVKDKKGVS
jgi:hypothetical protein